MIVVSVPACESLLHHEAIHRTTSANEPIIENTDQAPIPVRPKGLDKKVIPVCNQAVKVVPGFPAKGLVSLGRINCAESQADLGTWTRVDGMDYQRVSVLNPYDPDWDRVTEALWVPAPT